MLHTGVFQDNFLSAVDYQFMEFELYITFQTSSYTYVANNTDNSS